jgi:cytochrome c-type biogenesis protein CcmH
MKFILTLLLVIFSSQLLLAQSIIEKQAQAIDQKLIAPCCWTSTLNEHFSPESEEMKAEIRKRLSAGQSEEQIFAYFEQKHGERVLAQPKASGFNLAVWFFPIVALTIGGFLLMYVLRKPPTKEEITNTLTLQTSTPESDEKYKKMINQELYRSE